MQVLPPLQELRLRLGSAPQQHLPRMLPNNQEQATIPASIISQISPPFASRVPERKESTATTGRSLVQVRGSGRSCGIQSQLMLLSQPPASIQVVDEPRSSLIPALPETNRALIRNAPPSKSTGAASMKTSKYKGVSWAKGRKKRWKAQIQIDNMQRTLGYYEDELQAARSYNRARELIDGMKTTPTELVAQMDALEKWALVKVNSVKKRKPRKKSAASSLSASRTTATCLSQRNARNKRIPTTAQQGDRVLAGKLPPPKKTTLCKSTAAACPLLLLCETPLH